METGLRRGWKARTPRVRANAQRPHDGQAVALLDPFKTKACRTKISFSLQKRHSSSIERVLKHPMLDLWPGHGVRPPGCKRVLEERRVFYKGRLQPLALGRDCNPGSGVAISGLQTSLRRKKVFFKGRLQSPACWSLAGNS